MSIKKSSLILLSAIVWCFVGCTSSEQVSNVAPNITELRAGFATPEKQYHPETWFHFNGNNISKEGITLDIEAIKQSGLQGIQLFSKNGRPYPGVEQIKVLSPEWEDMVAHAANECQRLGLKFTMQNCPGWSMTGGPWVPVEESQREIVESVYRIVGGRDVKQQLDLTPAYATPDYDYNEVQILAFPTPKGDDDSILIPSVIESNNDLVPWAKLFNPNTVLDLASRNTPKEYLAYKKDGIAKVKGQPTWVKVNFGKPQVIRSIELPPIRDMIWDRQYPRVDAKIKVEARQGGELQEIAEFQIPVANWCDRQYALTFAIPETTTKELVFTFTGDHRLVPAKMHLSAKPRLHNHEMLAAKTTRSLEKGVDISFSNECIINPEQVINLSDNMDANGMLTWKAPQGDWTIVRYGHVNMRRTNKPAMPESTGWECSKLDKVAIENHLRNGMIGQMIKDGGPIGDGKLDGLLIDSWESYIPTWTMNSEAMFAEFEQRRGYSMKPYMPATMGYVVESQETSKKFLRDLRHTMDEVYIDNFFTHFATIAHEMGTEVYTEGAGGEVLPIDPMRYYGVSDVPMTEFWYPKAPSSQNEYAKPVLSAASAMHLYNKPRLAAEACTQLGIDWTEHPFDVKYLIDYNFTKGINHLVFHTFSHTPQVEVYPGSSFGGNLGFPFVRQQTWWKHMPSFVDYLARCQYILQQGEYAADVLWYYGDHFERPPFDLAYFPKGYRFDYLNTEILHQKVRMQNGVINVKDAGDYRVIMLRDSKEMLLSTAQKLQDLVLNGAIILGDKPIDSPSLMDDEADLKALKTIADQLWDNSPTGVKQVGKGKVYWGQSLDEVLQAENITPDVIVPEELPITWIHRKTADADIYFVSSTSEQALDVSLSFRVDGAYPELWDAFSGAQQEAKVWHKSDGRINVALALDPVGSTFVVFPKGDKPAYSSKVALGDQTILDSKEGWSRVHANGKEVPTPSFKGESLVATQSGSYIFTKSDHTTTQQNLTINKQTLNADWILKFTPGWEVPEQLELDQLASLTTLENKAVQHYSGTVIYTNEFTLADKANACIIDLGEVGNIAELWCNGQKVGTRWAPPYIFDLSEYATTGANQLKVLVTNTWRNQLVYDSQRPKSEKKTWTTNPPKRDDTKLERSGLMGPVVLSTMLD